MSKILTPFERALKEKMSGYEMPYEQRSWFTLQKSLGSVAAGNYPWIVALVATVVVTATGSVALYRHRHTPASAQVAVRETRFNQPEFIASASQFKSETMANDLASNPTTIDYIQQSQQYNAAQNTTNNSSSTPISTGDNSLISNPQAQGTETSTANNNAGNKPVNTAPAVKADNVIAFNCSVTKACEGVEVDFNVTNGPKQGSYLWNFGDGHFSADENPKHKFAKSGVYDISLSVTSEAGQINTTVMNDLITISQAPNADFSWEFVNELPGNPTVKIINSTEDATSYEWTFNDGTTSTEESPVIPFTGRGKHMIALSVSNERGCTDGAVKQVSINSDFNLDAPNAFTPGKQTFMPSGLKQTKVNFVMSIYDSNGKIYETSSRIKGWDGKLPGGGYAAAGTNYNWKVVITNDLTKEQKYFNGTLTVSP